MLKIFSPLNETCNIEELSNYADEFYVGISDEEWQKSSVEPDFVFQNTRGNVNGISNFSSWEKLKEYINKTSVLNKDVFLVLNSHNISSNRIEIVKRIIYDFKSIGGTGIICSNLEIIKLSHLFEMKTVISTNMAVYNAKAAEYLISKYDIDRIILSRDMPLKEIEVFRDSFKNEIEVFGMNYGCKFSNGLCFGTHNHLLGGICRAVKEMDWNYCHLNGQKKENHLYNIEINHMIYNKYHLNTACGLCALYQFINIGIDSFKIVGRELEGISITECIKKVYKCRDMAYHAHSEQEYIEMLDESGIRNYRCVCGYNCYYPELYCKYEKLII